MKVLSKSDSAQTFEQMRRQWTSIVCGDTAVAPAPWLQERRRRLGSAAGALNAGIHLQSNSTWDHLDICNNPARITKSAEYILQIAMALRTPGTGVTANQALTVRAVNALKHLFQIGYSRPAFGNWWEWQIGAPRNLLSSAVLLHEHLPNGFPSELASITTSHLSDEALDRATGANLTDMSLTRVLSGIVADNGDLVLTGTRRFTRAFELVESGDGFYADGSFIQHRWIPYAGSYGAALLSSAGRTLAVLRGTNFDVDSSEKEKLLERVDSAILPILHDGVAMDCVSGRAISRGRFTDGLTFSDKTRGDEILASIALITEAAPEARKLEWQATIKGHLRRSHARPWLANENLPLGDASRLYAIAVAPEISVATEPLGVSIFGAMDRAVARTRTWTASLSLCSERTCFYEYGNGENLRGWHTNAGMISWWGKEGRHCDQYSGDFWATVDPYGLPGTTVSLIPLPDAAGEIWGRSRPRTRWAGGCSARESAIVGMEMVGLNSSLRGKDSWFILGELMVHMGTGITSEDGYEVVTTVDSRLLTPNHLSDIIIDGAPRDSSVDSTDRVISPKWAHIAGHAGYYFLEPAALQARSTLREGRWSDINTTRGSTDRITAQYSSLQILHGIDPQEVSFAVAMVPGASPERMAQFDYWSDLSIIDNNPELQGVKTAQSTAINFWATPKAPVEGIWVSAPAAVVIDMEGPFATISIADPLHANEVIELEFHRSVVILEADPQLVCTTGAHRLKVQFDAEGMAGGTASVRILL